MLLYAQIVGFLYKSLNPEVFFLEFSFRRMGFHRIPEDFLFNADLDMGNFMIVKACFFGFLDSGTLFWDHQALISKLTG
jgi:hypothetical protein